MNLCGCNEHPTAAPAASLAIATVPIQPWTKPFDPETSLRNGTIFPNLYLPFFIGGEHHG